MRDNVSRFTNVNPQEARAEAEGQHCPSMQAATISKGSTNSTEVGAILRSGSLGRFLAQIPFSLSVYSAHSNYSAQLFEVICQYHIEMMLKCSCRHFLMPIILVGRETVRPLHFSAPGCGLQLEAKVTTFACAHYMGR